MTILTTEKKIVVERRKEKSVRTIK